MPSHCRCQERRFMNVGFECSFLLRQLYWCVSYGLLSLFKFIGILKMVLTFCCSLFVRIVHRCIVCLCPRQQDLFCNEYTPPPPTLSSHQMAVRRVGCVRTTFPAKLTLQSSDYLSCIVLQMLRVRIPARLATFWLFIVYHNKVWESKS
jgi:hypothetical protein